MDYKLPKGTFDIVPTPLHENDAWKASDKWLYVEEVMRSVAQTYGYREIRTPLFEMAGLFTTVGETSDIVSKEMYTFEDKGGRLLSLRPEGTAATARAFVENHFAQQGSFHKLYYIGPFFRYDRPQAGRFRQFHQFGIEALGYPHPETDVETIDLWCEIYRRLGVTDYKLLINSVGDAQTRLSYRSALQAHLLPHFEKLSPDSKTRFEHNPLRILDSKDPQDQSLLNDAPHLRDFLSSESRDHFECVLSGLRRLKIAFHIDPKLVRGLDYYNQTVFEVTSHALGAQNSMGGGGRYDGLIKRFGGPDLPSVGFSIGIERLLSTLCAIRAPFPPKPSPFVYLIPLGSSAQSVCLDFLYQLRHLGIAAEIDLSGRKLQKTLQDAAEAAASFAIVMGDDEINSDSISIKEMQTREAHLVSLNEVVPFFQIRWAQRSVSKARLS